MVVNVLSRLHSSEQLSLEIFMLLTNRCWLPMSLYISATSLMDNSPEHLHWIIWFIFAINQPIPFSIWAASIKWALSQCDSPTYPFCAFRPAFTASLETLHHHR